MIETARLRLVPWPPAAPDLASLGRELALSVPEGWRPDVLDILPGPAPPWGVYATVAGDRLVGSCGFFGPPDESGTVEIGYETAPDARRQGFASEAARALVDWARQQEGVRSVIARPAPDNAPSRRVLEHAGFRLAGTAGDYLLYELNPA